MKTNYPECEKLASVSEESQKIGEFVEWLQLEKEISFCIFDEEEGIYYQHRFDLNDILAEYFGIDLKKVEEERRQILENIRNPKPDSGTDGQDRESYTDNQDRDSYVPDEN